MTTSKLGRDFWLGHVESFSKSGQPLATYARQHAIAADSLRYWKSRSEVLGAKMPFVAARVQAPRLSPPLAATNVVIAVSDRVDPTWLASLARGIGVNA